MSRRVEGECIRWRDSRCFGMWNGRFYAGKEVAHDSPGDRLGLNGIRAGEAENQPRHGRANIPGRGTDPIRAVALRRAAL